MAWIESHQELETHPKLLKLSNLLKIEPHEAIGHLMCLWWWCLKYAEDGLLTRFGVAEVSLACRYKNDPEFFVKSLTESGFLDENPRKVHDWVRYAGRWLRIKYSTSDKQWLRKTWRIYGIKYGDKKATDKRHVSDTGATLSDLSYTNLSDLSYTNLSDLSYTNLSKRSSKEKFIKEKFKKPTAEEITAYAKTLCFELNGSQFFDFYESKGWLIGKSPMRDWKATVRTWKNKNQTNGLKPVKNINRSHGWEEIKNAEPSTP